MLHQGSQVARYFGWCTVERLITFSYDGVANIEYFLYRLLTTLTDALQTAGVDLSQARISVQIDLGNRANKGQMTGTSTAGV